VELLHKFTHTLPGRDDGYKAPFGRGVGDKFSLKSVGTEACLKTGGTVDRTGDGRRSVSPPLGEVFASHNARLLSKAARATSAGALVSGAAAMTMLDPLLSGGACVIIGTVRLAPLLSGRCLTCGAGTAIGKLTLPVAEGVGEACKAALNDILLERGVTMSAR